MLCYTSKWCPEGPNTFSTGVITYTCLQICEFESESQGVTPELSMAPANSPTPSPLNTFYVLPEVTKEYVNSGEGEQVYRVLGISSQAKRLLKGNAENGTITWEDAQSVRSSATLSA